MATLHTPMSLPPSPRPPSRPRMNSALTLITPEAQTVAIPKEQITERDTGPSSMPADIKDQLTKAELRDLIEYLASLK